jgi:low temperature requirement protein LtrA
LSNRPRLRPLELMEGERHASWLELFFDLVFVLAVSQVSRVLSAETDVDGFLKFIVLFVAVWWSWIGYTYYADRFETTETIFRVLMFSAMLGVVGLSLSLGGAFSAEGGAPFVACMAVVRLVLVALYARAAYYVPLARFFCLQFVIGLSVSTALLIASLLVGPPVRYVLWAGIFLAELLIPFVNLRATRQTPIDRSHLPERFGLFTIIVLGEAVIATATGAGSVHWNVETITTASLGFAMAACIWWINFDFVEDNALRSNSLAKRLSYLYSHLFIVGSIVATGVGVEHAIRETGEAHLHPSTLILMAGGAAVYLGVVTIIRMVTGVCNMVYVRIMTIVLALALMLVGNFLPPPAVVAAMFLIMAVGIWVETRFAPAHSPDTAERYESDHLTPCEHAGEAHTHKARSEDGCEECIKNNYKWVHLRLCLGCGHVGCCDTSVNKHATKHFHKTGHPLMASLETGEHWSWCYIDERFVPLTSAVKYKSESENAEAAMQA